MRLGSVSLLALTLPGCSLLHWGAHRPTLDEVSAVGDAALDLVDRAAVLSDARDGAEGGPIDLAAQGSGFWLTIQTQALQSALRAQPDEAGEAASAPLSPAAPTYAHAEAALEALLVGDQAIDAVLGTSADTLLAVASTELEEVDPGFWTGTARVDSPALGSAEARLHIGWVAVGWLAELRLSTDDGTWDDDLLANGFLAEDGGLGWWDVYEDDAIVAAMEWLLEDSGVFAAGIAPIAFDESAGMSVDGDILTVEVAARTGTITYEDNPAGTLSYVHVYDDASGEGSIDGYLDGAVFCWDASLADAACPEALTP
jgi:hypothetical protein